MFNYNFKYFKVLLINFLKCIYLSLFIKHNNFNYINSPNKTHDKVVFKECENFKEIKEHFIEFFSFDKFNDIFANFLNVKDTTLFEMDNIQNEFNYFCYLLLSGNISWKMEKFKMNDYDVISTNIETLLKKFESETFVYLNNKNAVIEDLAKHITCVYYRIKIHFTFLLENIPNFIAKYNNYFLAIKKNIYTIEQLLDIKFEDIEIYYILLHLISNIIIEKALR